MWRIYVIAALSMALLIVSAMMCVSCGVIQGSSHPVVDIVIKEANEHYPQDNVVEEGVEACIYGYTGFIIDLSPATPENASIPGKPVD